jgi:hypothetical protein
VPGSAAVTNFDAVPQMPLLLRARFAVADAARARVLELRVAYHDGFIAYVNGREVARRGFAKQAAPAVPHGPEVERVYVAVPDELPALAPEGNLLAIAIHPYPGRKRDHPDRAGRDGQARGGARRAHRARPYLAGPVEAHSKTRMTVIWETDVPATGKVIVERVETTSAAPRARSPPARARPARRSRSTRSSAARATATASRSTGAAATPQRARPSASRRSPRRRRRCGSRSTVTCATRDTRRTAR